MILGVKNCIFGTERGFRRSDDGDLLCMVSNLT